MRMLGGLSLLAAAASAGMLNRIDAGYRLPTDEHDDHVHSYRWHLHQIKAAKIRAEREAMRAQEIAAKRERDKPWIDAAEAKRARKQEKALKLSMKGKNHDPSR